MYLCVYILYECLSMYIVDMSLNYIYVYICIHVHRHTLAYFIFMYEHECTYFRHTYVSMYVSIYGHVCILY